ncbi:MAG: hypothetical protein AAGF84_03510 [Planctomycetota bacterium]
MSELIPFASPEVRGVEPRVPMSVRPARQDDFAWIDAMQKAESSRLGFLPEAAIRKRIEQGNLLIAEQADSELPGVGYCIAVDRYMSQDHVGQFIQLNVAPGSRRSLVGAALVQATFAKAAYGVKLFGLWCRQDLKANEFWQSLGFVALAFRTAGHSKLQEIERKTGDTSGGVHIYWQRPIRAEDFARLREGNFRGWWFPFETRGGLMGESRVVLPIPPEVSWREVRPVVLPGAERRAAEARQIEEEISAQTADAEATLKDKRRAAREAKQRAAALNGSSAREVKGVATKRAVGGVGFGLPPEVRAQREAEAQAAVVAAEKQRLKEQRAALKKAAKDARKQSDPELLGYVREMRDRWLEAVEAQPGLLALASGSASGGGVCGGGHDVSRQLKDASPSPPGGVKRVDNVKRLAA